MLAGTRIRLLFFASVLVLSLVMGLDATPGPVRAQDAGSESANFQELPTVVAPAPPTDSGGTVQPQWGTGRYVTNVSYGGRVCGARAIQVTSGSSGTLGMSVNQQVAATFTADATISAGAVSAKVGFSVTSTFGVTNSISIPTNGNFWVIEAYPLYDLTNFEIWNDGFWGDDYVGSGYALKPVGVCFNSYIA